MLDTSGLAAMQNPDGGWPYKSGGSCTEPTAYGLLALVALGQTASPAVRKASDWLARGQRADGGWAPRPGVDQTTWVTALVLLLPGSLVHVSRERALRWLAASSGRESGWVQRLRVTLLDGRMPQTGGDGWPWFPDTAAWVTPTCFGLLAAEKSARSQPSVELSQRAGAARQYLLSHTCRDFGWNHGSTKALGYDSDSYPETTGQALLALHGVPAARLQRSFECAQRHFESSRSLEALCWLKLGFLAHGLKVPDRPIPPGHGSVMEIALKILAEAAANGRNIFLE